MDWNVIQQYLPLYQKAAVLTVRLGVAGIFFVDPHRPCLCGDPI